jgi:hypothetical protein
LAQVRLEERNLACPELFDPLRDDVANRHLVAELGEAGAGDEADPTGAEDRNRLFAPRAQWATSRAVRWTTR